MPFNFILFFPNNDIKRKKVNQIKRGDKMRQDNLCLIRQIELINDYIDEECQENLFYTPRGNSRVFEHIRNASLILLNNAMRLIRNQTPMIKSKVEPLTLQRTKELMFRMYQITQLTDFPIIKENKIKKLMEDEYTINADELLKDNPSNDAEEIKIRLLLNGKE